MGRGCDRRGKERVVEVGRNGKTKARRTQAVEVRLREWVEGRQGWHNR